MSLEREGINTSDNSRKLLALIDKLAIYNEISRFEIENEDRSKDLSQEEIDKISNEYHEIGWEIAKTKALNLEEMKIKSQAFLSLVSIVNKIEDIEELIDKDCETQEAAAFSIVLDYLRFTA